MSWQNSVPVNPYGNVTNNSNYSQTLETNNLRISSLKMLSSDSSIGIVVSNGIIDGITSIENDSDAINKHYIIDSKKPSGPIDSIQYNNNGTFNGSGNLLFSGDYTKGTLITKSIGITDGIVNITGSQIINAPEPIYDNQLANKQYVDNYDNFTTVINLDSTNPATYIGITNTIVKRNSKINVIDTLPTADNIISQIGNVNITAKVATTANITLSGLQTIDNVLLTSGNIVLVKNQTNPIENGIYRVFNSQWFRISETMPSMFGLVIYVTEGTIGKNLMYTCENKISNDTTGIDPITFKIISTVTNNSYYEFNILNESTNSSLIISTNTGTTFYNKTDDVTIFPTYVMTSIVKITSLIPPAVSIYITSFKQGVKYLDSNFVNNTFQTNLPYRITNTFMIPGSSIVVDNTKSNYIYSTTDLYGSIVIRDPPSNTYDGFDDFITNTSFIIQNKSSVNSINISSTNSAGTWNMNPSPITIGPNKSQKIIIYNENGQNYATGLGNLNY